MGFQSTVNIFSALGIPGEVSHDGPIRATPYNINSTGTPNVIGYAYTISTAANPDPSANSANGPIAQVGGTGVFAGILALPKNYAANGTTAGGPLAPVFTLPDNSIGELLYMGQIFVSLPGPANPGDLVTYDPLTGALNSIPPLAQFTGSIAPGGAATEDVLTVSAVAVGQLGVGQLITGAGIAGGTYIASLGTGKGNTGTYNLTSVNLQTISSEAMTASPNLPATAWAASSAHIIGTTLTITTLTSGEIQVGDQVFGTGVLPNTVITALGSGVGGTGTYTVNQSQTTTNPIAMTGPANVVIPRCVVDMYGAQTAGGVAAIRLTN